MDQASVSMLFSYTAQIFFQIAEHFLKYLYVVCLYFLDPYAAPLYCLARFCIWSDNSESGSSTGTSTSTGTSKIPKLHQFYQDL